MWKKLSENRCQFYIYGATGLLGYYTGQNAYIVDIYALSDPFLARIGVAYLSSNWRIGHILRPIPDGYLLSRFTGRNCLVDPELAKRYEQLRIVTNGPLFTKERLSAIIDLNISRTLFTKLSSNPELRLDYYRFFYRIEGAVIKDKNLNILFPFELSNHELLVSAEGNYKLELRNQRGNNLLSSQTVSSKEKVTIHGFELRGVDAVRILPLAGSSAVVYFAVVNPEPFRCTYDLDEMQVLLQY